MALHIEVSRVGDFIVWALHQPHEPMLESERESKKQSAKGKEGEIKN